ncbi:MAG: hypothetical protein ACRD1E_10680 [Terriglobales bacterium]
MKYLDAGQDQPQQSAFGRLPRNLPRLGGATAIPSSAADVATILRLTAASFSSKAAMPVPAKPWW